MRLEVKKVLGKVAKSYPKPVIECGYVTTNNLCSPVNYFDTIEKCKLCQKTK